jgi:transcriptional regulator with XRE-family HTH domain
MSEALHHDEAPSIPFEDLPARMKRARERTGLHQAQIGAILRKHQRTIANYEGGNTEPKLDVLKDWARITNVPIDWLVFGFTPEAVCSHCGQPTMPQPTQQRRGTETRSRCSAENTEVKDLHGPPKPRHLRSVK